MKTSFETLAITTIFTISIFFATAQKVVDNPGVNISEKEIAYFSSSETQAFGSKVISETKNVNRRLYLHNINIRALRNFIKTYPDVNNERWEILEDGFIASFVLNSTLVKDFYNSKGYWLYSIDQYDETKLPKDIRTFVKGYYSDYDITLIDEINSKRNNTDPIYLVHLKLNLEFKNVKVYNLYNNELELEEETF